MRLIAATTARAGLLPGALQLEITETILMRDDVQTLNNLNELRRMGFRIAIDDFGVAYSSLSYLKTFDIDALKLDQSFLHDMPDSRTEALARGVVQLGHSLDMTVIAEGIETGEQLQLMQGVGCDEGQGYLLGRPFKEGQVIQLLTKGGVIDLKSPQDSRSLTDRSRPRVTTPYPFSSSESV